MRKAIFIVLLPLLLSVAVGNPSAQNARLRSQNPIPKTLRFVEKSFGVSIADLLGGSG